jgi:hypothetical protein
MTEHRDSDDSARTLLVVPPPEDDPTPGDEPPNNLDAEKAVLGSILLSHHAFNDIQPIVEASDFYRPAHELIYDAATALYVRGDAVDAVTVAAELAAHGQRELRRAGGAPYLYQLISTVPAPQNGPYYAQIVADHAARRRILAASRRIAQLATSGETDPAALHTVALAALQRAMPAGATGTTSPWSPVDIGAVLDGNLSESPPTILARADGPFLLYPGAVHSLSGEPESGKSWLALLACAQELELDHTAVYLDFEDRPGRVVGRLLALGAHPDTIRQRFRYIRPNVGLTAATLPHLLAAARGATLAVVDGITEAMTLHGLSLMDNEDVARWLALVPRVLADTGPAVLQIDHVVKNTENRGRYAIGGQHKLAGIDGCAYKTIVTEPFGRGKRGHARVILDKDREGHVREIALGHTVAILTLDSRPTQRHTADELRVHLDPPQVDTGADGAFRPTGLMEKVSRFLEVNPGATGRAITDVVRGKSSAVRDAIRALINEGYVRTEPGPDRSTLHWSDRAFREDEEA